MCPSNSCKGGAHENVPKVVLVWSSFEPHSADTALKLGLQLTEKLSPGVLSCAVLLMTEHKGFCLALFPLWRLILFWSGCALARIRYLFAASGRSVRRG